MKKYFLKSASLFLVLLIWLNDNDCKAQDYNVDLPTQRDVLGRRQQASGYSLIDNDTFSVNAPVGTWEVKHNFSVWANKAEICLTDNRINSGQARVTLLRQSKEFKADEQFVDNNRYWCFEFRLTDIPVETPIVATMVSGKLYKEYLFYLEIPDIEGANWVCGDANIDLVATSPFENVEWQLPDGWSIIENKGNNMVTVRHNGRSGVVTAKEIKEDGSMFIIHHPITIVKEFPFEIIDGGAYLSGTNIQPLSNYNNLVHYDFLWSVPAYLVENKDTNEWERVTTSTAKGIAPSKVGSYSVTVQNKGCNGKVDFSIRLKSSQ